MKLHVNNKGEARQCRALVKCRYSSDRHFDSKEAAQEFIESDALKGSHGGFFVSLRKPKKIEITETSSGANLLDWEKENSRIVGEGSIRKEILTPESKDFVKVESGSYTFFHKTFKGKAGNNMEHTVLGNPKILKKSFPNHNALARGTICASGGTLEGGMKNQHFLSYSVVEVLNTQSQETEKAVLVDAISIPKNLQGKGLASELVNELESSFPGLRIPETYAMTQHGKDFVRRLQASRGDQFKGLINTRLEFDPLSEGEVNYSETDS